MNGSRDDAGDVPPRIGEARELDVGALRALAHPLRVEIYDILSQFGPQTASSLAEQLGESSGATSYHLRALAKHDLIREVPDRGTGRERWWERPKGAVSMTGQTAVRSPAGRAASQVVISEFYRRRNRQLEEFIARQIRKDPDEWTAMLSTATVRLTDAQFEELSHELEAVIDAYVARYRDQQGEGVRPFTIRTDVFPLTDPE